MLSTKPVLTFPDPDTISGNNTEQVLQSQITDLQGDLITTGSNLSVKGDWLANNMAVGYQTVSTSDNNNTAVGCQALTSSITTGFFNTGVGTYSIYYLTEGINNMAVGFDSSETITTGTDNACLGSAAGDGITQGQEMSLLVLTVWPAGQLVLGPLVLVAG